MEKIKVNPEIFEFKKEDEEEILKRAGVIDLIELMKCENCLFLGQKEGKSICINKNNEVINNPSQQVCCSLWTERIKGENNILKECYNEIKTLLKFYIDTKEENYEILTLWIIGTWLHDNFPTYPYLFLNAMKGSGKTRLLKLIKELSKDGDMLASLSEAVMFRTTGTLCIDEFEGISSKDKNALRELLNTAYKKGGKVKRMRKKKTIEGEQQVVEEFNTFRPIVMANISGMEEVLQDRCITIILEKSSNPKITRVIENFVQSENITTLREKLKLMRGGVVWCSKISSQNVYRDWNIYITGTTLNYTTTLTTLDYTKLHSLFEKIEKTNIDGRNLELAFPLFMIAEEIGIVDNIIEIIKGIIVEKKADDVTEGKDIQLLDFVSRQYENEFYKVNEITNQFRRFINYEIDDETKNWLTNKWIGKALKRLNLILMKRRLGEGIEIILNIKKAAEKMLIFK